ncbi:MAG: helix-turn-helix domain-containing protein, partial [Candidatus Altiarchaeota archaeon]|nr:helix-turn-helix domain-containing protein [Candidatus Altiarchaeota archaeon]
VSFIMGAVPIIVGERMKSTQLSDGVVYDRYGTCVLNQSTFHQIVHNVMPNVYSTRGNYCVHVDSRMLSELRRKSGLTQEALAERLGVSKQSLYRYEDSGRMSLDVFQHLVDFFEDAGLILPTFSMHVEQPMRQPEDEDVRLNQLKSIVVSELKAMGFDTSLTKAPFDVVATREERIFTVVSNDWRRLKQKIDMLDEISGLVGGYSLCISERRLRSSTRVLSPEDLREVKTPKDFFKLLSD